MTSAFELPCDRTTVESAVLAHGQRLFPDGRADYRGGIFDEVAGMFEGARHDFPPNNLKYHDFAHTLQAACRTADYVSPMAAPECSANLPALYRAFEESDDNLEVPRDQRVFKSEHDLLNLTPLFWTKVVEPELLEDFNAVYRYPDRPFPEGPNPYLESIERNLSLVREHLVALPA